MKAPQSPNKPPPISLVNSEHSALPILIKKEEASNQNDSKQFRFPTIQGSNNFIECKWEGCDGNFTTYGRLSDHLKVILMHFHTFLSHLQYFHVL